MNLTNKNSGLFYTGQADSLDHQFLTSCATSLRSCMLLVKVIIPDALQIVSEMTYIVSSGTLNPTILYYT